VPTAVGHLRYGPRSHTVQRRSGWWLLLVCDRDWFRRYAPMAQAELPPQWVTAVDRERLSGGHATDDPRLAVLRPTLMEPAWKPHICGVRRERPKRHLDLWELSMAVGDAMDEKTHLIESAKYLRAKADTLLADARATTKVKHAAKARAEAQDALRVAGKRDADLPGVRRQIRKLQRRWMELARKRSVSVRFEPGRQVEFNYDPSPRSNGKHWWFDVECDLLLDLREVFGLRRRIYPDLHLTFAVREGCDDDL